MIFCVFSFNRGVFLKHCVRTIELCVEQPRIVIFDDNSFDVDTIEALDEISQRHEIVSRDSKSAHKLGGLYNNMQAALDCFPNASTLCFIQDDMQLTRDIDNSEIAEIEASFVENERLGFIHPCFVKGSAKNKYKASLTYRDNEGLYYRKGSGQSAGNYFSAVTILSPGKLHDMKWTFDRSEPANDVQASKIFDNLAQLRNPFAMWLPEVPTYRGKRKTVALKIAEAVRNVDFYPFKIMSMSEKNSLLNRSVDELPIAENFLKVDHQASDSLTKPWEYYPLQNRRCLKKLNNLELGLLKLLPK